MEAIMIIHGSTKGKGQGQYSRWRRTRRVFKEGAHHKTIAKEAFYPENSEVVERPQSPFIA